MRSWSETQSLIICIECLSHHSYGRLAKRIWQIPGNQPGSLSATREDGHSWSMNQATVEWQVALIVSLQYSLYCFSTAHSPKSIIVFGILTSQMSITHFVSWLGPCYYSSRILWAHLDASCRRFRSACSSSSRTKPFTRSRGFLLLCEACFVTDDNCIVFP